MKTLYLHIQLIFCWLIITTTIQASDVNGFHLIRSGYYIDALNLFSLKNDSISKLGTQYCYLLMNNIKFDLEKTSEYIFSENLPDSILGWVALDIIKSFTKEKEKQIFWEKILSRMPITAYNEMQEIYNEMAWSYKRTNQFSLSMDCYKRQLECILNHKSYFNDEDWKLSQCASQIYQLCDSSNKEEFISYCNDNMIPLDTARHSYNIPQIFAPNMNFDVLFLSCTYRDSLAYQAQRSDISLAIKLQYYIELTKLDSIYNTPAYKGGGYIFPAQYLLW